MTALSLRADEAAHTSSPQRVGSLGSFLSILLEAYLEARQMTLDARRKYPFADV